MRGGPAREGRPFNVPTADPALDRDAAAIDRTLG
jgi:hypothetical protein